MVYMLLGTGFEETEAIAPLDLLRRAGVEILTVGINGKIVYGSHKIGVEADIELGEVEIAVNSLDFIDNACCIYDEKAGKIVLFYQAEKECKREIVQGLGDILPKYMYPNRFEYYEKLPMSEHGKLDRVKLRKTLEQE